MPNDPLVLYAVWHTIPLRLLGSATHGARIGTMNTYAPFRTVSHLVNHSPFWLRLMTAALWTLLMLVTLLQSSAQPLVGQPAPQDWRLDHEAFLTVAHLISFGGFTLLWAWTFNAHRAARQAIQWACGAALFFSLLTETLQTLVPDRGFSVWDLAMNALGMWAARRLWCYWRARV